MSFDNANTENFAGLVERWKCINDDTIFDRDSAVDWLEDALHAAIKLEFSTIPPYLCALWSIKDQSDPIARSIRSVVQEEMLHMALACNMLVAIGGTPKIANPAFAPVYPGKLAGGVHDSLVVRLTHLSDAALEDFLLIERPERNMAKETQALKDAVHFPEADENDGTIGKFYDLLVTAFDKVQPEFETERQISGPLAWFPVRNLEEVRKAVDLIKHQGEGSTSDPSEAEDGELAHFYRFLEILKRRRIEKQPDGRWGFGAEIPSVEVYPMAEVPPHGFDEDRMPAHARQLVDAFDGQYTKLLAQLGDLWARGEQGQLVGAIETMFSLQGPARELMQIEIAGQAGQTYGPCFRIKEITA